LELLTSNGGDIIEKILSFFAKFLIMTLVGSALFYFLIRLSMETSVPIEYRRYILIPAAIWALIGIFGDKLEYYFKKAVGGDKSDKKN